MSKIDDMIRDCDNHLGDCTECIHFYECTNTFPDLMKKFVKNRKNNPSMLAEEIRGFEDSIYSDESNNSFENYSINICELSDDIIDKCINDIKLDNIEQQKIVNAALEKFKSSNTKSTVIKTKPNCYNIIFDCTDCNSNNVYSEYAFSNSIYLHCKYCGKKHQIVFGKEK